MSLQKNNQENWIRRYCNKRGPNKAKCKICHEVLNNNFIKAHLYRAHKIFREEADRNNLVWPYFTEEEEKYSPKCKLCNTVLLCGYKKYNLEQHLISRHPQLVQEILQKIIRMSISKHFVLDASNYKMKCKVCHKKFNIFRVNILTSHLLKHDIKTKLDDVLERSTRSRNNKRNIANQSVTEESNSDISSHESDIHLQAEEDQEDLERFCEDIIPQQKNNLENWIWQHCIRTKSEYRKIECNICHKVLSNVMLTKVHLYREHKIFHDEDVDRSNLVWEYFTEEEKYSPKCKLCKNVLMGGYDEQKLEQHLISKHPRIVEQKQKEVKRLSVSRHFMLDAPNHKLKCKICHKKILIFRVDSLASHLLKHDIKEKSQENIGEDNVIVKQSTAKENNVDVSSRQSDTHMQTRKNKKKLPRYHPDVMPAQQKNWILDYCCRTGHKRTCNICHYVCHKDIDTKVHLYRVHGIFRDEDVDRSNLVWQYFTEEKKYSPKCKICNKSITSGYKESHLESHLIFKHPQIIEEKQKEIERLSISRHFVLDISNYKMKCKTCHKKFNMFRVNFLENHLLKHDIEVSSDESEDPAESIVGSNTKLTIKQSIIIQERSDESFDESEEPEESIEGNGMNVTINRVSVIKRVIKRVIINKKDHISKQKRSNKSFNESEEPERSIEGNDKNITRNRVSVIKRVNKKDQISKQERSNENFDKSEKNNAGTSYQTDKHSQPQEKQKDKSDNFMMKNKVIESNINLPAKKLILQRYRILTINEY